MKNKIRSKHSEILNAILKDKKQDIGLFTGKAGIALCQLTSANCLQESQYENQGITTLENGFELIEKEPNTINTFCGGTAGVGWMLEFISRQQWLEISTNDLLKELDCLQGIQLSIFLQRKNWDFLHGAVGLGIYFLHRSFKNHAMLQDIESILLYLEQSKEEEHDYYKWGTSLTKQPGKKSYNISLSHGMSAIVVLLTKMYKANIFPESTKKLLLGCVNYVLNQEIDVQKYGSYFPSYSIESEL